VAQTVEERGTQEERAAGPEDLPSQNTENGLLAADTQWTPESAASAVPFVPSEDVTTEDAWDDEVPAATKAPERPEPEPPAPGITTTAPQREVVRNRGVAKKVAKKKEKGHAKVATPVPEKAKVESVPKAPGVHPSPTSWDADGNEKREEHLSVAQTVEERGTEEERAAGPEDLPSQDTENGLLAADTQWTPESAASAVPFVPSEDVTTEERGSFVETACFVPGALTFDVGTWQGEGGTWQGEGGTWHGETDSWREEHVTWREDGGATPEEWIEPQVVDSPFDMVMASNSAVYDMGQAGNVGHFEAGHDMRVMFSHDQFDGSCYGGQVYDCPSFAGAPQAHSEVTQHGGRVKLSSSAPMFVPMGSLPSSNGPPQLAEVPVATPWFSPGATERLAAPCDTAPQRTALKPSAKPFQPQAATAFGPNGFTAWTASEVPRSAGFTGVASGCGGGCRSRTGVGTRTPLKSSVSA